MRKRNGFTLIELPVVRKCKRRAFTLIELLVVVAIIALLVAILIPALQSARALAEQAACASNIKQIGYALRMYADDNDGKAPRIEPGWQWYIVLKPYMLTDYDVRGNTDRDVYYDTALGQGWFTCPMNADPDDYAGLTGFFPSNGVYGMNYPVVTAGNTGQNAFLGGPVVVDTLPAETLVLADATDYYIWTPFIWAFSIDADGDGRIDTSNALWINGTRPMWKYNGFRPRHPDGGNVLFADWHVGLVTLDQWLNDYDIWGTWAPR